MKKLIDISNKDYTTNPNTGINLNDYEVVNVVNYEENIILQKLYSKRGEGSPLMYFRIISPDDYSDTPFISVTQYEGNVLGLPDEEIKTVDDLVTMNDPLFVDLLETAFLPKILTNKENDLKNERPRNIAPLGVRRWKAIENKIVPNVTINDLRRTSVSQKTALAPTSHLMFGESRFHKYYNMDTKTGINMSNVDNKVGWGKINITVRDNYYEGEVDDKYEMENCFDYLNRQPYRIATAYKDNKYYLAFPYIKQWEREYFFTYPNMERLNKYIFEDRVIHSELLGPYQSRQFSNGTTYLYNDTFTFSLLDNGKYLQVFKGSFSKQKLTSSYNNNYDRFYYRTAYISARITDDTFNIYNTQININMDVPTHILYKDHYSRWGMFKLIRGGSSRDIKTILDTRSRR